MALFQSSRDGRIAHRRFMRNQVIAMTLIEVIGVLAILAILAAVILPALIRQTDKAVADQETATLQSYGNAIERYITRNRRIPTVDGNDWATNVAAEMGVDIAQVTNNVRRQPRVVLMDSAGFAALSLPYVQTATGTMAPANSSFRPRLMLISSLGLALPNAVATGAISATDFNNLWTNSTPGNFPNTGVWSGWAGNPNDITIQRLDLSKLIVNLWLSYNNGASRNTYNCLYAIDNSPIGYVTGATNYLHGYYIQNSVLSLYYTNPAVANSRVQDSIQILNRDSSVVFDLNKWVSWISNPNPTTLNVVTSGGSGGGPGGGTNGINNFDFSSLVNGFLAATATSLGPAGQTNVVQSFVNYMSNYNNWANSNFTNNTAYNNALAAQSNLMSYVNNLVNNITVH